MKSTLGMSILLTFYKQLLRQYSFAKKLQSQSVIREKLHFNTLSHKKAACKMLVKFLNTQGSLTMQTFYPLMLLFETQLMCIFDFFQMKKISCSKF